MNSLTKNLVFAAAEASSGSKPSFSGQVSRFDGHMIECDGFPATIGTLCNIQTQDADSIIAEVIGFRITTICYVFMKQGRVFLWGLGYLCMMTAI